MEPHPDRPRPAPHQTGLTRNEWVVILAVVILAVLATAPYLQHKHQASQRAAALQNLRQWGIALNLYLVENHNSLPASGTNPTEAGAWYNTLPVYLSLQPLSGQNRQSLLDVGLWTDPAARIPDTGGPESAVTYGMNAWLHPTPDSPPCRIYDVEDPTATFFLVATPPGQLRALPGTIAYRHGAKYPDPAARSQALFCDGHVEEITPVEGSNPAAAQPEANPPARPTWIPFFNAPGPD